MLNIYVSSVAHVSVISSPMIIKVVGILYEFVFFFWYMIIEYDSTSFLIFFFSFFSLSQVDILALKLKLTDEVTVFPIFIKQKTLSLRGLKIKN